jgi:hypothetical protein
LRGALHIKTRKVAGKLGTCMLSMHFYHWAASPSPLGIFKY